MAEPGPSLSAALANGKNLLALDGGGIRGASELLILKELMNRVQYDLSEKPDYEDQVLRPCDIFHLIGGSGTGGLIAILLGRLQLTIDEAIECYAKISKQSFSLGTTDQDRMSAGLEQATKDVVKKYCSNVDELLQDGKATKTFVLAMAGDNLNAGIPHFFRSYRARSNRGADCKIWEAVRATTATREFFKDIAIGYPMPIRYVGTTLGNNNPTQRLLDEAKEVFPDQPIGAVVSIGAGIPDFRAQKPTIQKTLAAICKDCEESHEHVDKLANKDAYVKDRYWRFSVAHGMERIELKDADNPGKIAAHTKQYLLETSVNRSLDRLADVVLNWVQNKQVNSQTQSQAQEMEVLEQIQEMTLR